jgi:hypothetical protein
MILSPDFPDHYKTKILIKLAGYEGVYCLLKLWAQCQFRKSEIIEKNSEIIAAISGWSGDPKTLEDALVASGYARRQGERFIMHQWQETNRKLLSSSQNGKKGGRPKKSQAEHSSVKMRL